MFLMCGLKQRLLLCSVFLSSFLNSLSKSWSESMVLCCLWMFKWLWFGFTFTNLEPLNTFSLLTRFVSNFPRCRIPNGILYRAVLYYVLYFFAPPLLFCFIDVRIRCLNYKNKKNWHILCPQPNCQNMKKGWLFIPSRNNTDLHPKYLLVEIYCM